MSFVKDLKIPLREISLATNGFSEENIIASGGFGKVYLGETKQHGLLAIKRLDRLYGQGDREFGMEIALLSAYKHENLVCLVGFCQEVGEKILVYKYEANESLDKVLHRKDLTWEPRLQICVDAARGLMFLHDGVGPGHRIIHRDIKSSNILLDENWKAKISDLGLSKIALANVPFSVLFSNPCGTRGYVDPEYLGGALTQKSDVFSFGVVLWEVLLGKLVSVRALLDDDFTIEKARRHYENDTLDEIIDPDLRNQMTSTSLRTFSTLAYRCTMNCRHERPTMTLVVDELENALKQNKVLSQAMHDVYICSNKEENSALSFLHTALRMALETRRLSVYKDNIENSVEESVLLDAIKQSRSSIIVFSKNFSSSSQNLNEAVKIIECLQEGKQFVLPIFYGVDISEVREQSGCFGETLSKVNDHNNRIGVWRNALVEAANQGGIIIKEQFQWSDLHGVASIIKDQVEVWGESNDNKKNFWCPLLDPVLFKNIGKKEVESVSVENIWSEMLGCLVN